MTNLYFIFHTNISLVHSNKRVYAFIRPGDIKLITPAHDMLVYGLEGIAGVVASS